MSERQASVIMRCKNSDWVIEQALNALFSQQGVEFELIVVDSGSTDRTLDIVRHFPCELIEIEPTQYVPGVVLNMAAERARSELLVFLNSDTVPLQRDGLARLVAPFAEGHDRLAATFARQMPRPEAHSWVRRDYAAAFPRTGPAPSWLPLSLPFAAMRKDVWRQHPFYSDAWASEDTEWGVWARESGWEVRYVAEAVAMHSHNYTLNQIYGRRFVEGEADAFIYGGRDHWWSVATRLARSVLRDMQACIGEEDLFGALASPVRRAVYQWAYFQGRRHGWQRLRRGDTSLSEGQQVILRNHDAAKPRETHSSIS